MKVAIVFFISSLILAGQNSSTSEPANLFRRQYREGETLKYHMKAKNEAWEYEIDSSGVVKKNGAGIFIEEIGWSGLRSGGAPLTLPPDNSAFRQELSLDPGFTMKIPDFSRLSPMLVGPTTDFMTFYSDLWLAGKLGSLAKAGDHAYIKLGGPNSWADGNRVILGEDSIDFDLTVKEVDAAARTAKLLVRHVPPQEPKVKLPAEWMKKAVADTPNNWVEVEKSGEKYVAEVGKEIFDVELLVSLRDGKLLSATLHNPVKAIRRECSDIALTKCGEAKPRQILRQIEIHLVE